jgi:hypothetical protein
MHVCSDAEVDGGVDAAGSVALLGGIGRAVLGVSMAVSKTRGGWETDIVRDVMLFMSQA